MEKGSCLSTSQASDAKQILLYRCPDGHLFHADPLLCGAFPGSSVHAVHLLLGSPERERTWFSVELLDLLASLRKHNAHIATDGFTSTLFELHLKGCGATLPSQEVTRRQLGKAVEEYEILLYKQEAEILDVCQDCNPAGCCACCSNKSQGTGLVYCLAEAQSS